MKYEHRGIVRQGLAGRDAVPGSATSKIVAIGLDRDEIRTRSMARG